jgi:hypothetical protein
MKTELGPLRLVPRSVASCPTEHKAEMRRSLGMRVSQIATQLSALILVADDLGERELGVDLGSMVERLNRHRGQLREGS